MKILAIIPARGGSKRLPGKNIKVLGDKPLIAWTIQAAINSDICCDVVVSTDDMNIAEISRQFGALVPMLRPEYLATDTATSVDVAIHALDAYEFINGSVDGILLLQPTSPFRSSLTIKKALALFINSDRKSVVSVSPASCHPAWCFHIDENGMQPFLGWEKISQRSQDLDAVYTLNGSVYLISPGELRQKRSFINENTQALVMPDSEESIDIDTALDWCVAEAALSFIQ